MTTTITELRKNAYKLFNEVITKNEPLQVNTKSGEAYVLSGAEYRNYKEYLGRKETAYLKSIPGYAEGILEEKNDPTTEHFKVDWENDL